MSTNLNRCALTWALLFLPALAFTACASSKDIQKKGLCRSDLTGWQVRVLSSSKASIEIPADVYHFAYSSNHVWIALHPVYPDATTVDDARTLLNIEFEITTASKLQADQALNLPASTNEDIRAYWIWHNEIHDKLSQREDGNRSLYRRDYYLSSNVFWTAFVELHSPTSNGKRIYYQEDDATIRRILNSFKPDYRPVSPEAEVQKQKRSVPVHK